MKYFVCSVLSVFLCAKSFPLFAAEQGAKDLDQAFLKALKSGDVEAVVRLYDENAVFFPPGEGELKGHEPIRFRWNSVLSRNAVTEGHLEEASYQTSGNLSVGWGRVSLTLSPKAGGEQKVIQGRFTNVAARRNRKWAYVSMMVSNLREPLTLMKYSSTPRRPNKN